MTSRLLTVIVAIAVVGCDVGERPGSFVIPGPTVPSPLPTGSPFVWDTSEELAIWMNNAVARGAPALNASAVEAFISFDRADREWVLRGPDLVPPATGVQTVRIRYRWKPDPSLPATASRTMRVTAYFQTTTAIAWWDPNAQAAAAATLEPSDDWANVTLTPSQYRPPIEVQYCYLHSFGGNRGVFQIDRIELLQ